MKKLLGFFKGSRLICVLAPLFKMLEATLELIVPLVMASIIDDGIVKGDKNYIIKLCIQLVVLGFIGLAFSITAQFFAAKASVETVRRIKHAAYAKVQSLSFARLDETGTSTLITRLTSDMDSVQNGINLTLRLLLRSPFVVIGACIMAFRVDAESAKTFAVVVPVLSVIVFGIMFITIPLYKKVRNSVDRVLLAARENITGIRVIRAFNKQDETEKEFRFVNEGLNGIQIFTGKISAVLNPLTCVVINLGIAALIYSGAVRVNEGFITTGMVVALYNYMSQILVELIKFANLIISITKSIACGSRIGALLEIENDTYSEDTENKNKAYIEFDNVSFRYNNSSDCVLENISFTLNKGEKAGIIGSTGAGKTTLINLLTGAYKPTEGKIYVDGHCTANTQPEILRDIISVAEQKPVVFKGTVRSNLLIGNKNADDSEIENALKKAEAYDFVLAKDGLDSETEQKGLNFSGGQRQRISLARAFIKNSDILILDDSYSALDYETEAKIRKSVNNTRKTIITVSQRTGSIMNCDKIIVLEDGKASVGTHDSLLSGNETYREIHRSQFDEEVMAE